MQLRAMNFLEGPLFENTSFISSPNLQPLIPTVLAWPPNGTQSNQIILKTAQEEMVSIPIECYCKQPEDLFGVICKKKDFTEKAVWSRIGDKHHWNFQSSLFSTQH